MSAAGRGGIMLRPPAAPFGGLDVLAPLKGVRDSYLWPGLAALQDAVAFNPYGNTAAREAVAQITGPPAQYTQPINRLLHGVGQDLPLIVGTSFLGGAPAAIPNMIGGTAGSLGGRVVAERGVGGLGQFATDMGLDTAISAAAAGPLAIPLAIGREAAESAAESLAKRGGRELAEDVVESGGRRAGRELAQQAFPMADEFAFARAADRLEPFRFRVFRGYGDDVADELGDASGTARLGTGGRYYTSSERVADEFSQFRPGGRVEAVDLEVSRPFGDLVDQPGTLGNEQRIKALNAPEYKKLFRNIEKRLKLKKGGGEWYVKNAANHPQGAFGALADALRPPGARGFWPGSDEASLLIEDSGFDSIISKVYDDPDMGTFDEIKVFEKRDPRIPTGMTPKAMATAKANLAATRFREVPADEFVKVREVARSKAKGGFLSKASARELEAMGTRTFLSEDGSVGYALSTAGDTQNVFNMGPKHAGKFALADAIRNGAKTLDAFDGYLTKDLYPLFGFSEAQRMKWADEYAPDNWDFEKYGRPDVVQMERLPGAEPMDLRTATKTFDPVEMRSRYPRVGLPEPGIDKNTGKMFLERGVSPEADAIMDMRAQIDADIKAGNYEPFFDLKKRYHVDPGNYPEWTEQTSKTLPKKSATQEKWRKLVDTPQARQRLKDAFEKGKSDMAEHWYAMGQIEEAYVKRLGPELGRKRFEDHITGLAATTGGNDPTSNWLMARWAAFDKAKGKRLPETGAFMPSPIGGRYAGGNAQTFNNLIGEGAGILPDVNPKRYDFTRNFLGHVDSGTIDEQMTKLMTPELELEGVLSKAQREAGVKPKVRIEKPLAPPGDSYGVYQEVIQSVADELGIDPRMLQEVAWAGAKGSDGKPMLQHINESIERTSKITGLSPAEVLAGWIDETLPAYSVVGGAGLANMEMRRKDKEKPR